MERMVMLFEERRSLVSFLASKLSDYSENEIIELVEIIEESLRLLEAHDYDWDRLERSFISRYGVDEGRESLRLMRDHLLLYREFRGIV